jgi:hypothetical protein
MQTLIMDSSQLSNWHGCHQEWAFRGLVQINKKDPAETLRPSEAIAAGSLGHKYLEIYYATLAATQDGGLAAKTALAFDPNKADEADKHQFPLDPALQGMVRDRVIDYFMMYSPERDYKPAWKRKPTCVTIKRCRLCGAIRNGKPLPESGCQHEVVETLADSYVRDSLIEKGFSYKLYESSQYLFVLEGRIDFMGEAQDGTLLWMDHKFQFREHQLYHKSLQFKNYSLATGLNMAVINYVRLHTKVGPKTFVRQPLSFSSMEMRQWKEELIDIYVTIAKTIASPDYYLGDNHSFAESQNRGSCGGAWGKSCQYAPMCEEYEPAIRNAVRKRDFTTKKEWRPW